MSIVTMENMETRHLEQVLEVIHQRIESLRGERSKGRENVINYRKYMWEDAALFDRAEFVQNENVALTQERAVLDANIKLKRLRSLAFSPYFGRIDFRELGFSQEEAIYIGLHTLFDDEHNLLIYDWRAPVSSMFYDCEVGPAEYIAPESKITGDLLLKRQYKIENGQMRYVLDCSLTINDDILRDTLAKNTSEKMRQIVNSIQKEQNAIIRSDGRKILIVQGPAGSGKTSIAMHRAAYLLYRHRGHISANNLLIFSPSEVFADYISNVLPELGEENIREATFEDYARSIIGEKMTIESRAEQMEYILSSTHDANYALRTAGIALKSSAAFLHILHSYVRHMAHTSLRFTDIVLNNVLLMRASAVEDLYKEYCIDMPILPGLERLKDRVLSRVTYSSQVVENRIRRMIDSMFIDRDPAGSYRKLFDSPRLVMELADGDPLPENLHSVCKHTYKSLHGGRIPHEDVAGILLLKRLVDGEPRYANIRHLIIDEAQDYTPVHFEIIAKLFGESHMTILGDLSQAINPYSGLDNYDALREVFGSDAREVVRLTKSYRSSFEISEFARGILPDADGADNVRRSGRKPEIIRAQGYEQIISLTGQKIDELRADGMLSTAVICKTAEDAFRVYSKLLHTHDVHLVEAASITFHHGLVVLPAYLAKGLEFDAVIIADGGSAVWGEKSQRKLLYTACTRALHSLTIFFSQDPSPLLPIDKQELFEFRDL